MPSSPKPTDLNNPLVRLQRNTPKAYVNIQGSVLEYKVRIQDPQAPSVRRGSIKDLSPGARLRMLKHFQKIDFENHVRPLFVTLTYPDEVPNPSLASRNLHRQHMHRRLERVTGRRLPLAWRVEWQPRKSGTKVGEIYPHWHLLIFKTQYISMHVINEAWQQTIGHDGYVRTDIQGVDKGSAISLYMAKYISKEACSPSLVIAAYHTTIGRQYGWLRKGEIPMQSEHRYGRITQAQRDAMMTLADEQLPWVDAGREQSFTLFGDVAQDARRILDGERLDE